MKNNKFDPNEKNVTSVSLAVKKTPEAPKPPSAQAGKQPSGQTNGKATESKKTSRNLRRYGAAGEQIAAEFLEKKGYTILARNYTVRGGELDIVACHRDEGILCFAEVKTRSTRKYGAACEAIDAKKRACMQNAAERYLYEMRKDPALCGLAVRFDVIEVYTHSRTLRHIKAIELQ